WKVIAKDAFDAETESVISSFTTRDLVSGSSITEAAGFAARAGHTSLVFDDKMWVIGGSSCCGGRYNDVWSSTDGANWTEVTSEANFPKRTVHASVVFDNKMWVIGGNRSYYSGNEFDDIWNSSDGITWTKVTGHTNIGPRYGLKMLVFDNKMWILGGKDVNNTYSANEVWSSSDGITWTRVSENTGVNFYLSEFTVFNNKIWRIGGYSDTNIYSSTDGITWVLEEENAPYGQRHRHSVTVWDDKIWLISGSDKATNELQELDDVWYTEDGKTWQLASEHAGYTATANHTSLVYDDKIWKIAGGGGWQSFNIWNDVWTIGY
ncbi:hypothetical protein N9954_09265, partial [Maribacter sp.]|nr:hypothetical protein [Maribacter sp.]